MVVDAHAHACGDYLLPETIVEILNENQVDRIVLVPGEKNSSKSYSIPELARAFPKRNVVRITNAATRLVISVTGASKHIYDGNFFVRSLVERYPERIIQFYWASISRADLMNEMHSHYREWKFAGIKLHQCWETFRIRSDLFEQIAQFAKDRDLPIFIHLSSKRDVRELADYIERNSEVTIIIGHLFGLEYFIAVKADLQNVFFDISSPQLISEYRLRLALDHYGAEKLIFGTDTPYGSNNLGKGIKRIRSLGISDEQKQRILGRNIAEILRLDHT